MTFDWQLIRYFGFVAMLTFLALFFIGWLIYARGKGRKYSQFDIATAGLLVALDIYMAINAYSYVLRKHYGPEPFLDFIDTPVWLFRQTPLFIAVIWFVWMAVRRLSLSIKSKGQNKG